jgi:hypothetical protein
MVTMIVEDADPNHIYGYAVTETYGEAAIVHYVYIKHAYRKMGLAAHLLTNTVPKLGDKLTFVTHESRHHSLFAGKYNLEYNPYII